MGFDVHFQDRHTNSFCDVIRGDAQPTPTGRNIWGAGLSLVDQPYSHNFYPKCAPSGVFVKREPGLGLAGLNWTDDGCNSRASCLHTYVTCSSNSLGGHQVGEPHMGRSQDGIFNPGDTTNYLTVDGYSSSTSSTRPPPPSRRLKFPFCGFNEWPLVPYSSLAAAAAFPFGNSGSAAERATSPAGGFYSATSVISSAITEGYKSTEEGRESNREEKGEEEMTSSGCSEKKSNPEKAFQSRKNFPSSEFSIQFLHIYVYLTNFKQSICYINWPMATPGMNYIFPFKVFRPYCYNDIVYTLYISNLKIVITFFFVYFSFLTVFLANKKYKILKNFFAAQPVSIRCIYARAH